MGDMPEIKDIILITLPLPEPVELVDQLRQKFKNVEIKYKQMTWPSEKEDESEVANLVKEGKSLQLVLGDVTSSKMGD